MDDSTNVNLTQKVVSSILDDGLESAVEYYYRNSFGKNPKIDTLQIARVEQILYNLDKPVSARNIMLFREMYTKGELDTNFMNDKNFLKALTINY